MYILLDMTIRRTPPQKKIQATTKAPILRSSLKPAKLNAKQLTKVGSPSRTYCEDLARKDIPDINLNPKTPRP